MSGNGKDDNIVGFNGNWYGHIPPKEILEGASKDENIEEVLVLAYTKDGRLIAASSVAELGELFLMVERFKFATMAGHYETD